ncbi:Peptidase S10, serine carboxypeptidase [Cordyceps fumosorosea ARSEF 2679]|uniref:Peptidase S10, serine carboxypeptidase n=1 Tax=Cordyceps fumosorosea (strain ARSEF 2679) TaxID=1081104 RepID=A0A162JNI6_CORFA|nr:Peptidase S10, serine carboxypeptidase [Cordyceps fumosorosea ARSEF 2679]OAA71492.1 Peptidase S10, serine carboxypeptidase [Cordyceps fumosorosea ARSEF 2679]
MVALHLLPGLLLGLGLGLGSHAAAQFVTPPTGFTKVTGYAGVPVRYKQVPPGICELDPKVRSFSGYADVAPDQHMFFWFFEARDVNPAEAPLTVWVSGGPGSSSMNGLWKELGPCRVDYHGDVFNNPHSWSRSSNLLFVDQPTHVGFSYAVPVPGMVDSATNAIIPLPDNTCPDIANGTCGTYSLPHANLTANSTVNAAPNMWRTLQGFMGAFPQYSRRGLNFVSQSYGGHYAPVFAEYFLQQNAQNIPGTQMMDLRSVLVGNGWYDPLVQFQAHYNISVSPGNTYDFSPFNASTEQKLYNNLYGPGNCVDGIKDCYKTGDDKVCHEAEKFCVANSENFLEDEVGRDGYDIRQMQPNPFPYHFYHAYLNRADVQAAIGAHTNFTPSSAAVLAAFQATGDGARTAGSVEAMRRLVAAGVDLALWAGDADYICNWLGSVVVADMVAAPGWASAGYADLKTSDGRVNAQVRQSGGFSFARFFEAGHEMPFFQPLAALEYFERVIGGRDIATGETTVRKAAEAAAVAAAAAAKGGKQCAYSSMGSSASTYHQGNGTVQFAVTPKNIMYDTGTHKAGAPWPDKACSKKQGRMLNLSRP